MTNSRGDDRYKPLLILLVEDTADHAEMVIRTLKENGVVNRIVWVKDGEEALDYLYHRGRYADAAANPRPNLILLDLRLPKVDGLDVLKTVRADRDFDLVPVVILTASAQEKDMLVAGKNHANSFVVKPVGFDEFNKLVRELGFYWLACHQQPRR